MTKIKPIPTSVYTYGEEDNAENRLKNTFCIVEADDFAQYALWCQHAKHSLYPPYSRRTNKRAYPARDWKEISSGWLVQVGTTGGLPVYISVHWAYIDRLPVMFWYGCSRVTDSILIEIWLDKHFNGVWEGRRTSYDAMNFHNCLIAIDGAKKHLV